MKNRHKTVVRRLNSSRSTERCCPLHPLTQMICPRCIGKKGGKATTLRHSKKLSKWGKRGGRPTTRSKSRPSR